MNINIFNEYYNYKIKTLYEYSILLSKIIGIDKNKLWNRKKKIEDSLKWIVEDYLNSYITIPNNNLFRMFISDKDISKYRINREINSVINYFIKNAKGFEIKAYEKEIVLIASIIYIANALDVSTSPYKNNKNNYKTITINLIERFNQIPYFNLIDNGKKHTNELIELIKSKVKRERRIFETINSKTSFNKYIDISTENKFYLTQYNYSLLDVKKIDELAVKYVYDENNIDDEFVLISKDINLVTLMKLFSIRKLRKIFLIPTKKDFYQNEKNVKNMEVINSNQISQRYLRILINYNDFDDKLKNIVLSHHLNYYLYCSRNSNINDEIEENHNYLFSKEFYENNKGLYQDLISKGKNIIIEEFEGIVMDNDLINEMEERS